MYADFVAGWMAGSVSLLVGHPLDTIKTRLQTMKVYNGFGDCLSKTVINESVLGLYKGMLLPFISAGALHSLLFASYATTLKLLRPEYRCGNLQNGGQLPLKEIIVATLVSATVQLIPGIPIEHIKTKLQVQREKQLFSLKKLASSELQRSVEPKRATDVMLSLYRKHGICGLYKGGLAMLLRDTLGLGLYLPIYETTKFYLCHYGCTKTASEVLSGGTAGSLSWITICPFEVMKNVSQTGNESNRKRLLTVAKTVFANGGIRGFYKGGATLIVRGFIVNSVLFVVYEKTLKFLQK